MSGVTKRILIVDDERDIGLTVKIILENYGFLVDSFTDPEAALKNFKPSFYDLLILDIKMPEINGFELYHQFRSRDSNIKALFLTALSNVESYSPKDSNVYPIRGLRHFLKKPVSTNVLLEQVYSMVN